MVWEPRKSGWAWPCLIRGNARNVHGQSHAHWRKSMSAFQTHYGVLSILRFSIPPKWKFNFAFCFATGIIRNNKNWNRCAERGRNIVSRTDIAFVSVGRKVRKFSVCTAGSPSVTNGDCGYRSRLTNREKNRRLNDSIFFPTPKNLFHPIWIRSNVPMVSGCLLRFSCVRTPTSR